MDKVKIKVNGKKIVCKAGERLIDAAQREGEYIPRFCYHPKLSVVASCRMCLVEIKGCQKSQPACATLVQDGMEVSTQSKKTIADQKAMMEFLLVNHPLHCPICDQGGECELQDTAMGYGLGHSDFSMEKRAVVDEDLGPLVATDMSLCIHCTRCVRFGKEIAGVPEIGLLDKSDQAVIGTYLKTGLKSELSGNMIDICPVGALTSKPLQFKGRSWGFLSHQGVSSHDGFGSNLYYHTLAKGYDHLSDVMRVVPRKNTELNDIWLSDRDRFSYEGIQVSSRLSSPKVKKASGWVDASWEEALGLIVEKIQNLDEVEKRNAVAWLSSQNTMEEGFLAQQLFRSLGIDNLDSLVCEKETASFIKPLETDFEAFEAIVLLGCNVRYEQSILAYWIKKAVDRGVSVVSIGAIEHDYGFDHTMLLTPSWKLSTRLFTSLLPVNEGGEPLLQDKKILFIAGEEALTHPMIDEMCKLMSTQLEKGSDYLLLHKGPNALGLKAVGAMPNQGPFGKNATGQGFHAMMDKNISFAWLGQLDLCDFPNQKEVQKKLSKAFVVSLSGYHTESLQAVSDVMLPVSVVAETPGSFVNYKGNRQLFKAATRARDQARMGWSVYNVMLKLFNLPSWEYEKLSAHIGIHYQIMKWENPQQFNFTKPPALKKGWIKLGLSSWVRIDPQLRHAQSLQKAYPKDDSVWANKKGYLRFKDRIGKIKSSEKIADYTLVSEKVDAHYEEEVE